MHGDAIVGSLAALVDPTYIHGVDVLPGRGLGDFADANAMAAIAMSEKGKTLSEAERGQLAGQVAAESRDLVSAAIRDEVFVLPMTTLVATAHV